MNEDHPPSTTENLGWLERLGKSLLGEPADREQLVELLRNAQRRELLDTEALSMIEGVLQVAEMKVRDIMIPRGQMDTLDDDASLEEMVKTIVMSGHSRFPVYSKRKDSVVGIVLAKDLLRYLSTDKNQPFDLDDVLRNAVFIPESKRLNDLLNEFRDNRNHMAIIVDEYGNVAGLVTIEDVLEQIVGEIDDEHDFDEVENSILEKAPDCYTIKALTPLDEFNDYFKSTLDQNGFDTIGGLVVNQFGHLPKREETVTIDSFLFKVIKADGRRVHLLEVSKV